MVVFCTSSKSSGGSWWWVVLWPWYHWWLLLVVCHTALLLCTVQHTAAVSLTAVYTHCTAFSGAIDFSQHLVILLFLHTLFLYFDFVLFFFLWCEILHKVLVKTFTVDNFHCFSDRTHLLGFISSFIFVHKHITYNLTHLALLSLFSL